MSTRRETSVRRCPECRIHQQHCFCQFIKPFSIESTVSIIVHVRELKLTSNTAYFVQKMLPENTHLDIRGRMNDVFDPQKTLKRKGRPIFLYPDEDAQELNDEFKEKYPGPYHLIVPDGSWHQARKVHQREELLSHIPTVKVAGSLIGEYQLRHAPQPFYLSTFEAIAHALGVLEGTEVRDDLMKFFRIFVRSVMQSRHNFHGKLDLSKLVD
jgi:DTW domain-containing protein